MIPERVKNYINRREILEKHRSYIGEDLLSKFPTYYETLPSWNDYMEFFDRNQEAEWKLFSICRYYQMYMLWTKEYIDELADFIKSIHKDGNVLEVGAGDGMLSYWLRDRGIPVVATDDNTWKITARAPVRKLGVKKAIKEYNPEVVVCSWPTMDGKLDKEIFFAEPPKVILIGEGAGGCTGSGEVWNGLPRKLGYVEESSFAFDEFALCRTDHGFGNTHLPYLHIITYYYHKEKGL